MMVNLSTSLTATGNDTLLLHSRAYPVPGDTTPANNSDTVNIAVLGSYDPNMVIVSPEEADTNFFSHQEFLEYTILFQNTGTDTAVNVVIKDFFEFNTPYSSQFNILHYNSLEIMGSSHPFEMDVEKDTLRFVFANIMLPDSNASEPNSHGFVKFRIRPALYWESCSEIPNFADIYFDFNPPVRTNTAISKRLMQFLSPMIVPGGPTTFCYGGVATALQLSAPVAPGLSYHWNFNNSTSAQTQIFYPIGTTDVVLTVSANNCSVTDTLPVTINSTPGVPAITVSGSTSFPEGGQVILSAPANANFTYSWSDGTTTRRDTVTQEGTYSVTVTNQYGCSKTSTNNVTVIVWQTPISDAALTIPVKIYPNPARDEIMVEAEGLKNGEYYLTLFNSLGELILTKTLTITDGKIAEILPVISLSEGVYFLQVDSENGYFHQKVIKE